MKSMAETMRAFLSQKYGPPTTSMKLQSVKPPAPTEEEVLIRIHSVSLNPADWRLQTAEPWLVRLMAGMFKPKNSILGADVAGVVAEVGAKVTQFKVGDAVFGDISHGGFAEYTCAKESLLARKPSNVSFEEASTIPLAGLTALHSLRDCGKLEKGQSVLVNGASGGVGIFAVQLAKHLGAGSVTAVCSTRNVETMQKIGADKVLDYIQGDICERGEQYDLVINNALFRPLKEMDPIVAPNGCHVMVGGDRFIGPMVQEGSLSKKTNKRWNHCDSKSNQQDLNLLKDLAEQGVLNPVISHRYTFDEIPKALEFLQNGHPGGKLVINYL